MAVNHVQPARMPVSPKRLERSRYPPSTKFGKLVNVDGSANIHSIDWTRVALKEPQNVSDWIVYLHNNESPAIHSLLRRVQETLDEIVANSQYMEQWRIYAQSHLPLILMDIVLDRKMFSPDPNVFTVSFFGSFQCTPELTIFVDRIWNTVSMFLASLAEVSLC